MSLDKFVMRGFTGSLGSGEGKWVSTSSAATSEIKQNTMNPHPSGSSFVMGGSSVGFKPRIVQKAAAKDRYSEYDSSNGEASGGGDRYSFDRDKVRDKGTQHSFGEHRKGCFGGPKSLDKAALKRRHQITVGIVLYGVALFALILCLVVMFGDGKNSEHYNIPTSLNGAKPMWAND